MDILNLIKPKDLVDFLENYNYKTDFMGERLFPSKKTEDIKLAIKMLQEGGTIPVMAQIHAYDSEARIGDRPNFKELELTKLLIKEKINQTERIAEYLGSDAGDNKVVKFIYDDLANMVSRNLVRAEVMKMQVMSDGEATVNENNVSTIVSYGLNDANKIMLSDWSNPAHDIVSDLNGLKRTANKLGFSITNALTSSKVLNYIMNNTAIKAIFANSGVLITEPSVIDWISANFKINIETNDLTYKKSANDTTQYRFFDEDKITFFGDGVFGNGFYGITPEERKLSAQAGVEFSENMFVAGLVWNTEDPVATWTKASSLYIPVPKNINQALFCKVD